MKLLQAIKFILMGRTDCDFYREHRNSLRQTNYGLLKLACIFSTCMCLFLFALTFFIEIIFSLRIFYFVYTFFFAALIVLVLTVAAKKPKTIPFFFYLFASVIFALAIEVSTTKSPDIPAVTFYVFLIIIPILYVTKPLNAVILSVVACAMFCVVTGVVKDWNFLAKNDILNAICVMLVGIGVDLTILNLQLENIRSKLRFQVQSTTDELTSLANRRNFNLYIDSLFSQCAQSGQNVWIFMLDIDDFKLYNDTRGHVRGDDCLVQVASALSTVARAHEIFLARFGGEEFIAAVGEDCNRGEAEALVEKFLGSVRSLEIENPGAKSGFITVSVGCADRKHCGAENYMKLLDCADEALYRAKRLGKNRSEFAADQEK